MQRIESNIGEAFEERVGNNPDSVALVVPGTSADEPVESLTYSRLNERANLLARQLRGLGVQRGDFVALKLPRGVDVIVAMLAVAKAGGAYVPLDPADPRERLNTLLDDLSSPVLITLPGLLQEDDARRSRPLVLNPFDQTAKDEVGPPLDAEADARPDDPAYVMFTSGSTGKPKGVVVPHRAVVRLARGDFARMDAATAILQLAPLSFDASTFEIWGALLNGGRCVLYPGCGVPDFKRLGEVIETHQVTSMWLTASLFNVVIDQQPSCLSGLEELLTGGEALSVPHVRRAQELLPEVRLVNGYGPTENTTFTCCFSIPRPLGEVESVPIGTSIAYTEVEILDDQLKPVADGEVGELCAAGEGVALGYLNRSTLTREKFVDDPMRPGRTLYRTGDRVRRRDDGIIEFLGRVDDQVKLHGHRIELGEVETRLREHQDVGDAVVVMRQDGDGVNQLVAYFTADGDTHRLEGDLHAFLRPSLPEYMIPSYFIGLDVIPLTPNGKADRKALPAPEQRRPSLRDDYTAPRNPLEEIVAKHWCELLGLERVGVHDRFFEVGGSSIKAMQLIPRLEEELGQEVPVVLLFQAATVAEIADCMVTEYGIEPPANGSSHGFAAPGPRAVPAAARASAGRAGARRAELRERRRARRRSGSTR